MSGRATVTMVTSTSSMNAPRQTAVSGSHLRIGVSSVIAPGTPARLVRRWHPPRGSIHPVRPFRWIPTSDGPAMMETMKSQESDVDLDDLDRAIVQALMVDGRAAFSRIAEVLGVSDQTVIRRYRRLRTAGVLRVLGLPVGHRVGLYESWLRIQCTPDAAVAVADALARRPDIAWVTLVVEAAPRSTASPGPGPSRTGTPCCCRSSPAPAGSPGSPRSASCGCTSAVPGAGAAWTS